MMGIVQKQQEQLETLRCIQGPRSRPVSYRQLNHGSYLIKLLRFFKKNNRTTEFIKF